MAGCQPRTAGIMTHFPAHAFAGIMSSSASMMIGPLNQGEGGALWETMKGFAQLPTGDDLFKM